MSDEDVLRQEGNFRVRLIQDTDCEQPDYDGQGDVLYVEFGSSDRATVTVMNAELGPVGLLAEVVEAYHRYGIDDEMLGRYLRIFHDVVSFDYMSHDRGTLLFLVTREHAEKWGCESYTELATQTQTAWRQWGEGDVWGYVIEQNVAYVRMDKAKGGAVDENKPDLEQWEQLDSLWGLYGSEYAETEAVSAFDAITKTEGAQ